MASSFSMTPFSAPTRGVGADDSTEAESFASAACQPGPRETAGATRGGMSGTGAPAAFRATSTVICSYDCQL